MRKAPPSNTGDKTRLVCHQFIQNDTGLAVSTTDALVLKLGNQVRHNSDGTPRSKNTDQLLTTNLVYKF